MLTKDVVLVRNVIIACNDSLSFSSMLEEADRAEHKESLEKKNTSGLRAAIGLDIVVED